MGFLDGIFGGGGSQVKADLIQIDPEARAGAQVNILVSRLINRLMTFKERKPSGC